MANKNRKFSVAYLIVSVILIVIDQASKLWALKNLEPVGSMDFIPGFMRLTYVENRGAAFGILQGHTNILSIVSALFLLLIVYFMISGKIEQKIIVISLSLVVAGGIGNLIDRIVRGYVVDYFDLTIGFLKDFPVFNFADCCVVIGGVLLLIFSFIPLFKDDKEVIS